jgi:methyltransferase-like protein 6
MEPWYLRNNGTRTYFFTLDKLGALVREAGFEVIKLDYVTREVVNVRRNLHMHRTWIQAIVRRPP